MTVKLNDIVKVEIVNGYVIVTTALGDVFRVWIEYPGLDQVRPMIELSKRADFGDNS